MESDPIDSFERAVAAQLNEQLGKNVGEKVYLDVLDTQSGQRVTVIPDNLERVGDAFVIHEAKFSSVKDLLTAKLRNTFTPNQKVAFDAISEGRAVVTLKNSRAGETFLGEQFKAGMQINVSPKINVYVNTPKGIEYRVYTGKQ